MTSLLARSRKAATSIWTSGQRPTSGNWQCTECRKAKKALGYQRRELAEDTRPTRTRDIGSQEYGKKKQERELRRNFGQEHRQESFKYGPRDVDAPRARGAPQESIEEADEGTPSWLQELRPKDKEAARRDAEERDELWEQFSQADEDGRSAIENAPTSSQADRPISRYQDELSPALLNRESDRVARCLLTAIRFNDLDFIRNIPKTTFSEIIRRLHTRHFVAKLGNVHVELGSACASSLNVAPMREVAFEYASLLQQVLAIRRAAGIDGTLGDCRALLQCARDLGNRKMAQVVWSDMSNQAHVPDTTCYNYFMSATVWNGMHLAGFRQKVRVVPFFTMARKSKEWKDRRYGDYSIGEGGVLESTMRIFNEMVAQGVAADEESFRILIVAAAREGDMITVKAILKRVWNIDVDGILANSDNPSNLPKVMPPHSPLYPRSTLLFTIAHAFGTNNDVPAAIRLVDFVSRYYDLRITQDVWSQLFEWTFVLSVRRHSTSKSNGSRVGQISADSVQKLWQTMIGEPYNIKPTMGMYNFMIKSLFQRDMSGRIAGMLENHVSQLYKLQRQKTKVLLRSMKTTVRNKGPVPEHILQHWEIEDLIGQRNSFWMRRWIRLLLGSFRNTFRLVSVGRHFARSLPRVLWQWREHVPTQVRYETPTGLVQLEFRSEQELVDIGLANYASKMKVYERVNSMSRAVGDEWIHGKPHLTRRLAAAKGIPYETQTRANMVKKKWRAPEYSKPLFDLM